jgi:hypothetical protein
MIDERNIELIHADLDGELSREERAELARVLLANPEARALRDELSRLFGELARLDEVSPPAGLTTSVLARIPAAGPARRWGVISGGWDGRAALRYAAVFVGGLLTSAAVFQLGRHGAVAPDVSELVGTIGGHDIAAQQTPADRIRLELDQVDGTINSWELGSQLVLELDLRAREPVEVVAHHGDQTVRFSLGAQGDAAPEHLLWLPAAGGTTRAGIDVTVLGAGGLLYEGTLEAQVN